MRHRPYVFAISIFTISLFRIRESFCYSNAAKIHDLPPWDYLMFSQRWAISACIEWEEKAKNNVCKLPAQHNSWLIHGLWPTKSGTNGPNNCDSAIHFDPDQLQPILNDLNEYWTNIEGNTKVNSFWSHEWDKHGTCASSLPQLNSVYNYFHKGLELHSQYNMLSILKDSNISPNMNNYTIDDFYSAIFKKLNVTPQVQCVVDSKTKESLISELRLCFNRSFQLINCTSQNLEPSNCSKKKAIKYLADIPGEMAEATVDGYFIDPQEIIAQEQMLHEWYILIKFLIWFTL
ncbi:ribonuclease Oy-like [Coccinella septempunctata]|uniref:ribonuclease Oy-like n=1 Tax=Coccinella septempunctata TaxID=41139 RepID=UPI001D090E5C|nr:ribonuclease Oy-like [Coccinella septempunctata]